MTDPTAKQPPDWERIERDFRAGMLSLREIAESEGITHAAIRKRAIRDGWDRDLGAKIKAKTQALVSKALVSTAVSKVSERAIIDANADHMASVETGQRQDAARARKQAMRLLAEVEAQTGHADALQEMGDRLADAGEMDNHKAMAAFMAVLSLPGRVKTMAMLGDTIHKLVMLERTIYRQDEQPLPPSPKPPPTQIAVILPGEGQRAYMDMISRKR